MQPIRIGGAGIAGLTAAINLAMADFERVGVKFEFNKGFGMKYAILSGCLAARAIIENKDYWIEVKEKIHPLLKAGIANRFIWGRLGNKGYVRLLKRMTSIKNIRNAALRHYQFTIYRKILFPFAKFILRKKLIK